MNARLIVIFIFLFVAMVPVRDANASAPAAAEAAQAMELIDTDLDKAERLIMSALKREPQNAEYHFYCGRIMGRQAGDAFFSALSYAKKSLACLNKAVELVPDNVSYRKGLVNFYLGAPGIAGGDEQLALEQINIIKMLDANEGAVAELDYYIKTDDLDTFEHQLRQAIAAEPAAGLPQYQLGLLLQKKQAFVQAQQHFVLAAKQTKQQKTQVEALYQIGRNALFAEHFIQDGITALQAYLQHDIDTDMPSAHWAHYRLSQLLEFAGQTEQAAEHLALARATEDKQLLALLKP
ncbi:hypothetical protein SAMN06297280_1542 [Arsukibacterium tuosuense]|uniref:Tetratricopeptide repeat protein n=1 Tax=Arsukibacterium tuosuense TaxID=1323745 RepID=A0A285IPB2_9GAMM|nr:hypothetical protein [Arsukibacterium tuosuense]SNY49784.1 hypothetical protein SAMN06297280_1542 [Arsukibacterium tuosuense]